MAESLTFIPMEFQGWSHGKTFQDLQAMQIAFVQGILPMSPYHFGPLDPESSLIQTNLYHMNRHGLLTVDSQPFEIFPDPGDTNIIVKQFAYVNLYIERHNVKEFLTRLLHKRGTSLHISLYDIQKRQVKEYGLPCEQVPSVFYYTKHGKLIKDANDQLPPCRPIDGDDWYDVLINLFGRNFAPLVQNSLCYAIITDKDESNSLTDDLATIAKYLDCQ